MRTTIPLLVDGLRPDALTVAQAHSPNLRALLARSVMLASAV